MFTLFTVICINIFLFFIFFRILSKKSPFIEFSGGRWYLTPLSVALPVLLIQLSSVFYAAGESFKHLGYHSLFFIIVASFFYNYLATRYLEISEIMHHHKMNGEGIFGFTKFVLGPLASFVFFASVFVTYLLTICIASVSAMGNNVHMFLGDENLRIFAGILLVWIIALIEILGIKIPQRILFYILGILILFFINLITLSLFNVTEERAGYLTLFFGDSIRYLSDSNPFNIYGFLVFGLSISALFFNAGGLVVSNNSFIRNWRLNFKTYLVIAFITILLIPALSILSYISEFNLQRGDIFYMPFYAAHVGGEILGFAFGIFSVLVLGVVIKLSFNHIAEALSTISKQINFLWIGKLNQRSSYYRIHILTAFLSTLFLLVLQSSQQRLAEMLAFGILINIGFVLITLFVYRYFRGSKEISIFKTSKAGTFFLFLFVFSMIIYLIIQKVLFTFLWIIITSAVFFVLYRIFKSKKQPQTEKKNYDNPMDLIFYLSEMSGDECNIYFVRPKESLDQNSINSSVYINFFSPNENLSNKVSENHFRFPYIGSRLLPSIVAVIELLKYEIPGTRLILHFGWPLSSWLDRISIGIMVFSIMKLPKIYPDDDFTIEYITSK